MKLTKDTSISVKVWLYDSPHPMLGEKSVVHTGVGQDGSLYMMVTDPESGLKMKMKMSKADGHQVAKDAVLLETSDEQPASDQSGAADTVNADMDEVDTEQPPDPSRPSAEN